MQVTLNRQKLCFEDFEWGTSIVEQTRGGVLVELTQLNAAILPYNDTQTLQEYLDSTGNGDMTKAIYDTNNNGIVDNSELVNGLTVETAVPAGALFTDTVYDPNAVETLTNKYLDDISNWIGANHIHYNIKATENLPAGAIVMGVGYNSGEDVYEVAKWTLASGKPALGMNHHALLTGEFGFVGQAGHIKNIDTSTLSENTIYYPADGGLLTAIKPSTGYTQACVYVLRSHSSQGAVIVSFSEPLPAVILKGEDIGVTVQAYDANITKQGNTFNGVSQLVQTDGTGKLPAIDGSALLNLPSGFSDPMTTRGDIIIRDASNITTRLSIGTVGQVLGSDGTDISWIAPSVTEAQISDLGTTIVLDTDIGSTVQAYNANNALTSDITFETLNTNGDIGTGSAQVAAGDHNHSGVYEPADATILKDADIGVSVQAYDATILNDADIGVSVQPYDADTAKTDVSQTFTASQRGTLTADNDGSFDMNITNNFKCTPTANFTLTFTNIAAQGGTIILDNSGGYTISAAATTKVDSNLLATISTAGIYVIAYQSDGTNVYVTGSQGLA